MSQTVTIRIFCFLKEIRGKCTRLLQAATCMFERRTLKDNGTTKDSQKLYIIINILNENLVFQICRTTGRSSAWVLHYLLHTIL